MDQYLCCDLTEFLHVTDSTAMGLRLQKTTGMLLSQRGIDQLSCLNPGAYLRCPGIFHGLFHCPRQEHGSIQLVWISQIPLGAPDGPLQLHLDNCTTPWTPLTILRFSVVTHAKHLGLLGYLRGWHRAGRWEMGPMGDCSDLLEQQLQLPSFWNGPKSWWISCWIELRVSNPNQAKERLPAWSLLLLGVWNICFGCGKPVCLI